MRWSDVSFGGRATNRSPRKFWSFTLLFEQPCADAEEVETSLIKMFARDETNSIDRHTPEQDQRRRSSAPPPATSDAAAVAAAAAAAAAEEAAKAAWLAKQDTPAVGAPPAQAPAWGGAPAPAPAAAATRDAATSSSADWGDGKGFGGGEATRDPEPTHIDPSDPKSKQQAIHKAESFADYLASRSGGATASKGRRVHPLG